MGRALTVQQWHLEGFVDALEKLLEKLERLESLHELSNAW
jgi:hypothetical protein